MSGIKSLNYKAAISAFVPLIHLRMSAMAAARKRCIKALRVSEFLTTTIIVVRLMRHKHPNRIQQEFQMHQITGHFLAVSLFKIYGFTYPLSNSPVLTVFIVHYIVPKVMAPSHTQMQRHHLGHNEVLFCFVFF